MALDRLGNTVTTGTVYVVAGTARVIDGDQIVLVGGNGGETVLRARAGDIARVDDLGGGGGVATRCPSLFGLCSFLFVVACPLLVFSLSDPT